MKNRAVGRLIALSFLLVPLVASAASGTLIYSTYVGSAGEDEVTAIAVDAAGNVTAAGWTRGAAQNSVQAGFVTRVNADGSTVAGFNSIIGGQSDLVVSAIVRDAAGNTVVAGSSGDTGFVTKFDGNGEHLFSTNFAATPKALALDSQGGIYVAGYAEDPFQKLQTTSGVVQSASRGGYDAAVLKLSITGAVVWATYLGGSDDDLAYAISVDSRGVYIAGSTASSDFPRQNPAQASIGGFIPTFSPNVGDAFVAKLDLSGSSLLYSTYWGGRAADAAYAIAIDPNGNAYIAGGTHSGDFPVSNGAYQTAYGGSSLNDLLDPMGDAFVAKFGPDGRNLWSTLLGGASDDWLNAIALDANGNVYVAGATESSNFPQTSNAIPTCSSAGRPVVAELDPSGAKLLASTVLPGLAYDEALALAVNSTGVYVAGDATSQAFFAYGAASLKTYNGGGSDGFVAKLNMASTSPGVFPACVLNAASFLAGNEANFFNGAVTPGEIVSLFGVGLGPDAAVSLQLTGSGSVATALGGTQVLFDGIPAPLLYAGANQVNAVVPFGINPGATKMTVTAAGGQSDAMLLPVTPSVPSIFTVSGTGQGQAVVLNQDYTLNSVDNPAAPGSYIMIYAEGGGLMTPAMADGSVAPGMLPLPAPAQKVRVTIRGSDAPVQYAGAAPYFVAGMLQINAQIPASIGFGNSIPLFLNVGGQDSQYNVTIAVK